MLYFKIQPNLNNLEGSEFILLNELSDEYAFKCTYYNSEKGYVYVKPITPYGLGETLFLKASQTENGKIYLTKSY